jgi:ribosome-associated protein
VIADYFVIASARNTRHARALASAIDYEMKQAGRLRRNAAGVEGESSWVLIDFDDVVVHIFQADARAFYDLESLWADVPRVAFEPAETQGDGSEDWGSIPDSTGTL